jgi:hypothetical protein
MNMFLVLVGIDPQVFRAMWPGLAPFGARVCGLLLVVIWGKAERRRLLKIIFWALPAFSIWTAYIVYTMVIVSRYGISQQSLRTFAFPATSS